MLDPWTNQAHWSSRLDLYRVSSAHNGAGSSRQNACGDAKIIASKQMSRAIARNDVTEAHRDRVSTDWCILVSVAWCLQLFFRRLLSSPPSPRWSRRKHLCWRAPIRRTYMIIISWYSTSHSFVLPGHTYFAHIALWNMALLCRPHGPSILVKHAFVTFSILIKTRTSEDPGSG